MKAKWTGNKLWAVLNLPYGEFSKHYPDISRNTYKGKRGYWKAKLLKGEIEMPPSPEVSQSNPEREQLIEELVDGNLVSQIDGWWDVVTTNPEDPENPVVTRAYKHSTKVRPQDGANVDELFPQVEASVIRPTSRRRAQRLGEYILGYGDGQVDFRLIRDPRTVETEVVPLQNIPMHRIILRMNAHYMPEHTINGGDMADFAGSSRFPKDSDHFDGSLTLSMQWIHDFYSQMVADNPKAKHIEVASNHGDRPRKKVLKEAPEFYNFRRPGEDYPAWTYYSMAKLGELGIIHPSGYPQGEYVHGEEGYPQILFKHGSLVGNTAVYKEADRNPTINVVRWHNHGERMIKRTTREGQQLFYLILGSSCINNSPVPGYSNAIDDFNQPVKYHNPDHVNSFVMIRDYGKGRFEPVTIDVVDGKAFYDGMEWDGTEPFEWEKKYGYKL